MSKVSKIEDTMSITFGDVAENHVGMQKVGELCDKGFILDELRNAQKWFEQNNCQTRLIILNDYLPEKYKSKDDTIASLLLVKNAVNTILENKQGADLLFEEQKNLNWDKKVFMYGRVVNKHARYNICYGKEDQEPNYEKKEGRICSFENVPHLKKIREKLGDIIGENGNMLQAEGNYYYDINKCGIGYHGDAERKKVIALRLGAKIPLCYIWYKNSLPISERIMIDDLEHGDLYIMSEKTTGFDWKKKSIITLRHAAGSEKYIAIKAD